VLLSRAWRVVLGAVGLTMSDAPIYVWAGTSAAPLDLYLVGQTTLGGSGLLTAKGYICARRVR
jgi:hypothetical protein